MRIEPNFRGFRAQVESDELNLLIYGVIAEESDDGEPLVRASDIAARLQEFTGRTINVYINSPGGVIADAVAIHTALRRHTARKLVQIDGVCASAATIVALAGDRISAAPSAMLMIHNASNTVRGEASDMRREAGVLDVLTQQIARLYMARTHRSLEEVLGWMQAETWLTAAEAKALGLIDEISATGRAVAQFDLSAYGLTLPGATDGGEAVAQLRREVAALRAEVGRLNATRGNPEAAAVKAELGAAFYEWVDAFKAACVEVLKTDPVLCDAAADFREDADLLRAEAGASEEGGAEADELDGADASGETELARLLARVKGGPKK